MRRELPTLLAATALASLLVTCVQRKAAEEKEGQFTQEQLAVDPSLFLRLVRKFGAWDAPAAPAKIVGPIYFVGTKGLGAFLITGSEGHVVLYTGMPGSGAIIEKSITQLGFNPKEIKIILTGHAHCDHVGGHRYLQSVTGAKIAMMQEEVELFESGGKADFQYGAFKDFGFEPVKVDTVFRDGDEITLGDIAIKVYLTPGHTKGSATYVTRVRDNGNAYTVVLPDGTNVNPGYRVGARPSYPGIADDYRRTFRVLEGLKPDIWLSAHNEISDLHDKLRRAERDGAAAWIDPEGYAKFVVTQKEKFEAAVRRQTLE